MPNTDKIINKYKSFEQVSGTETTDMHRPSLGDVTLESLADKNNKQLLLSSKVRAVIQCTECQKPRCIYVASKPTVPQLRAITRVKEELGYMCGSQLFDDEHEFHSLVITRQAIGCSSHVETVYYSSTTVSFPDCCFYCGTQEMLIDDQYISDLKKKFAVVRPLCSLCRDSDKQAKMWGAQKQLGKPARKQ